MSKKKQSPSTIAVNKKARHLYELSDFMEAGICLTGPEVKSVRAGKVNFIDSYVDFKNGEALLLGMGVDAVSASPRFVPGMKHMLRHLDAATCMDLAYNVLMSADISASQRMVRERLQESLGSELAFHTTSILAHCHE